MLTLAIHALSVTRLVSLARMVHLVLPVTQLEPILTSIMHGVYAKRSVPMAHTPIQHITAQLVTLIAKLANITPLIVFHATHKVLSHSCQIILA